jgi:signal peptidase II
MSRVPSAVAGSGGSSLRWLGLSACVIVVDQLTKAAIVDRLTLYERHAWLPLLEITRLHNRGAAFSFLNGASGWQTYLFMLLALLVSGVIVVWLARLGRHGHALLASGLACIVGGALGNAIDRLARGYVVDFIHFHWYESWYFPAFNVADTSITIGAALVILDSLLDWRRERSVQGRMSR